MEKNIESEIKKTKQISSGYYFNVLTAIFLLALGFWFGYREGSSRGDKVEQATTIGANAIGENNKPDFSLFWNVWDILQEKYVDADSLDFDKLYYGAIKGMLKATGDPYTAFLDPEENKKFNEEMTGNFEGIGAEIGIKHGILTIIAPLEGSPAEKSGLRPGDKIIKINGETTVDIELDAAIDKIRGQKGTEVKLTVFREGQKEANDISVIRDVIDVKSVSFEDKNEIAYIKISKFGEDTASEFNSIVQEVVLKKYTKIILDLRSNPGGYLDAAISMSNKLLPRGNIIVIEEDKNKNRKELKARGGDVLSGVETVVLIDEGSASASEILAGALRENRDNVTIIGKRSFGKGTVQELRDFAKEKAAVKITVAKWLTPEGNQINKEGIKPDIEIEMTNEDYENDRDPQLDKALELLR